MVISGVFQKRGVGFTDDEVSDYVYDRGKKDSDIGGTGGIGDAFGGGSLIGTGITDGDGFLVLLEEAQVEDVEDLEFLILA